MNRRRFLAVGAGVAAAGVGVYAWQIEPYWLDVVRRPMPLEHLPTSLEGATLLHVSDAHVGPRVSSDYLMRAFETGRALAPDFVAFTGDAGSAFSCRFASTCAPSSRCSPSRTPSTNG